MRKIFATILFAAPWTSVSAQNIVFTSDEVVVNNVGFLVADVFMMETGTGIVTWIESNGNVFARRFDANGNFLAPQFLVGLGSTLNSNYPQTDGDADGNFIVAWMSVNSLSGMVEIRFQRYDSSANALGSAVLVTSGFELIDNLRITVNDAGDFIVAWLNLATMTIYAARFNSLGIAQGVAVPVAPTISNGALSDIVINDSGDFFISWTEGVSSQIVNLRKYSGSNSIIWTRTRNTVFSPIQDALGLDEGGNVFLPAKRFDGSLFVADIFKYNTDGQAVDSIAQVISVSIADPIISGIASFQNDIIALSPNGQTQEIAMQYYNAAGLLVGSQTVANSSPMAIRDSRMSANDNFQGVLTWTRLITGDQVIRTFRVNHVPFDMTLSNQTISESASVNTYVGRLGISDVDVNDSSVFTLVNGAGSENNNSFMIRNDSLFTVGAIDFETTSILNIRIRAQDTGNQTYDSAFLISVMGNSNFPPYDVKLSNTAIEENNASNSIVGILSATDDESPKAINFTLLDTLLYPDNASFYIVSDTLFTGKSFDFEKQPQHSVGIRAADIQGLATEKTFDVEILDIIAESQSVLNPETSDFRISPNPFSDQLSIFFPQESFLGRSEVWIIDLKGSVLMNDNFWVNTDKGFEVRYLNTSHLQRGLYILRLVNYTYQYGFLIYKM